jgi:hypothetical protein
LISDVRGLGRGNCHALIFDLAGSIRRSFNREFRTGDALVGNVSVSFWTRRIGAAHSHVARQFAAAANNILASHGPGSPHRINRDELMQLIRLLGDIHGLRLSGLWDGWAMDHIGDGAAADFWSSVEIGWQMDYINAGPAAEFWDMVE